jgi:hypothetical protein
MTLKKGVYDTIKWIALIFLPAAGAAYVAVAAIWDLKYATQVTNTVLVVDTFLGALVGISSKGYEPPVDGHVYVSEPTPGQGVARMEFNTHPERIVLGKQKYMTLKVLPDPGQTSQQVQVEMPGPVAQGKNYD